MRSSKQWKIQQLIRMAELCDLEQRDKKIMYMEMAEDLLISDLPLTETLMTAEELTIERYPTVILYLEKLDDVDYDLTGKIIGTEYEKYLLFCQENNIHPETKKMFSKAVRMIKGFTSKTKTMPDSDPKSARVFT